MKKLLCCLLLAGVLLGVSQQAASAVMEGGEMIYVYDGGGNEIGSYQKITTRAGADEVLLDVSVLGLIACSVWDGVEEGRYFYMNSDDQMQCLSIVSSSLGKGDVNFS